MYFQLLLFEVKNRLWRLSSLVYFLVYFALAFMLAITFAGAFQGASVTLGLSNKLALNSPVVLNFLTAFIGYFGLLVVAPIFGQSINKDFENKFSQILFATPIKKFTYFSVRYLGSLISSILILTSISFGVWLATFMPFIDRTLVADNRIWFYFAPYLTNLIPNLLIFGGLFIAVASYFKKMAPVYIASIVVFTGWLIAQTLTSDLENKFLAAMIEPLGLEGISQVIRYWSVAEQSTRVVPLTGPLMWNRLLWGAIGLVFLTLAYWVFDPFSMPKEKKKTTGETASPLNRFGELRLPKIVLTPQSWRVFIQLAWSEFKQAFSNVYFLMILLCGILYIFSISSQVNKMFGTETLPVTYQVLEIIGGSFGLFIVIITTFYAGELMWKERDHRFYELVDSKPVANVYIYLSKLLALVMVQVFLSVVVMICCVIIQTFKGYYNYEWPLYFKMLFLYMLPVNILTCVMALFVHSLVGQKYIGHSIVIAYFIASEWLPALGFDHRLYLINIASHAPYSDMNGFGTSAYSFIVTLAYWSVFQFGLALLTILFWPRGAYSQQTFSYRRAEARRRMTGGYKAGLTASLVSFAALGGFIFYNTNILNQYESSKQLEHNRVDYELKYKSFDKMPKPTLISANVNLDLFPETQSLKSHGTLIYENKSGAPVGRFLILMTKKINDLEMKFSHPTKLVEDDKRLEVKVYEFSPALLPGEKVTLEYSLARAPKGFANGKFDTRLVENGAFVFRSEFTPYLNYNTGNEIEEAKTRRKYKLADRPRLPDLNDKSEWDRNYIQGDGDWIDFEATVSTSPDQIAVAPGYLQKEWVEGGRRYFHYKMDKPILDFFAVLSARYEVARDKWNDVNIEVYHHPGHTRNIERMIRASKSSLDYFSKNFSPYQFKQYRILEFPRYDRFAQAFPNTIPFSEAIGFIARVKENDPEQIDYPFYVTAHELAHQWWAHQLIGANVQGSTMLSESLAQYSALMVQEKEYGPKQMRKFLKYELDRYLNGRSREPLRELPISINENQLYIHYQKGSLVFYALKDYLGEAVVNKVLSEMLRDHAFRGPPYPRGVELVERFKKVTPPELQYLITDLFETITLYDNRTDKVEFKKVGEKYEVTVTGFTKKVRADETGKESEVEMNDRLDVGLFDKDGNVLYLQKHGFKSGVNSVKVEIDSEPYKGGIDPLNKLIDRVSDDNQIRASAAPAEAPARSL